MARYSFRPPLWASLLSTLAMGVMLSAGFWQLSRGDAKRALIQSMLDAELAAPRAIERLPAAPPGQLRKLALHGRYDPARQLLQDNQTLDQVPGYHVWTPLRLDSGQLALVDRGWVAQNPDRSVLPALDVPAEPQQLQGLWRPLPAPGLKLSTPGQCPPSRWPQVVQYPDAAELACIYGEPVADGLLLLDPQAPAGFVRRWQITPEMPPERHYAYAVQWFALALTVFVLFARLNLKRSA